MGRIANIHAVLGGYIVGTRGAYNDIILADTETACAGMDSPSTITVSSKNTTASYDSFVGTNVLQEMLYDPDCVDSSCISNYTSDLIRAAVAASAGIVMAILSIVFLLVMSPCMCSRKCRQSKGWKQLGEYKLTHKSLNPRVARFMWFLFILLSVGTLTDIVLIARNDANMESSLDISFCEMFKFMNETINGGSGVIFEDDFGYMVNAQWPGLGNLSDVLGTVTELANPNSTVIQGLYELVNVTEPIEVAFVNLSSTYSTLNTVMKANSKIGYHSCVFCTNYTSFPNDAYPNHPNYPSVQSINSSLGYVVSEFRHVAIPLVNETAPELYTTLVDMQESLDSFVENLNSYINESILGNMNTIKSMFTYFTVAVIILLVFSAGPVGLVYWALRYATKKPVETKPSIAPAIVTCGYTFLIFLISGMLLLVGYFSASTCLIFEDIGSVAAKMAFRFSDSDTVSQSVTLIVAECLRKTTDGDILSGVIVSGDSSARDKIDAITQLGGEFNAVHDAALSGITNAPLETNTHLVNMGKYLKSIGNMYLMSQSTISSLSTSSSYMKPTSATNQAVWEYAMESTPQCADRSVTISNTPTGVLSYIANYTSAKTSTTYTVPGMNSLISKYSSNGISTGVSQCPSSVSASLNKIPWGNIENTKIDLIKYTSFRCDTSSLYEGTDGFYYPKSTSKTCAYDAYATYMSSYGTTITEQAKKLDTLIESNFESVLNSIWELIYDDLLAPLQYLGEELNCQFISARWNTLMSSLCGDFTPNLINLGKTMFALGFMGLFFMIIQFVVWRHRIDNYYLWLDGSNRAAAQGGRISTYTPARIQVTQSNNNASTISAIMKDV